MSNELARVNEHLDDLNKRERIRSLKERFDSIIESTAKEKIQIKPGEEWTYESGDKTIYYVEKELDTRTDRELIGKCLSMVAESLYFTLPELEYISDEDKLDKPEVVNHFFRLVNATQAIRAEEMMMGDYNGTYDSFLYKFLKVDSEIDPSLVGGMPRTMQYLYALARQFWGQEPIPLNPMVQEALENTEEELREVYEDESSYKSVKNTYFNVFPEYRKLLDEDEKNPIAPPQPGEGEGEGGGGGAKPMPKELADLVNDEETMGIDEIMDKLKELSEEELEKLRQQAGESEGEGEGEGNFGRDIEQEYDEKEQEGMPGGQKYGQTDPVLNKRNPMGHEEKSLAEDEYMSYEQLYKEVYPYINAFSKKLNSIMKDNRYNRYGGGYRTGRLNNKKLYRRMAGSDKIFSRKIIRRHKDYAVTLLIDESGSMCSSSKNRNAAKATVLFAEVLNKVGIDFEIRAFNQSDRCYKTFHQKFGNKERRNIERIILNTHSYDACCNNDGFAVNKASYFLNRHGDRDTERMMIVLSDGLPAESGGQIPKFDRKRLRGRFNRYDDFDLRNEILKASQNALLIGVGIKAHHVREYYQNNAICDEVSELPKIVLGKIKKNIKRG